MSEILEAASMLFMLPLPPENSVCCVAALEHRTTMHCALRLTTSIFRGQPEGLVSIFAHFCIDRRSFSHAKPHSSRLELHKNGHQRGHE